MEVLFVFKVINDDCLNVLAKKEVNNVDLIFLDPPFNQNKKYRKYKDKRREEEYWDWIEAILFLIFRISNDGGAIYFMQREKNLEYVLRLLKRTGWITQNIIIWKKMTSAVPQAYRFGKSYQIIVFATKGKKPRVFNTLRVDSKPKESHKFNFRSKEGFEVNDVWDDIRELTSGFFAGNEPLRDEDKKRIHKQQSPVSLLLRIILTSTKKGDVVLDPFAGTGTTLIVAEQLKRESISIELDDFLIKEINKRLNGKREEDDISKYREYYRFTEKINEIF